MTIINELQVECVTCKASVGNWCKIELGTKGRESTVIFIEDIHWVHRERRAASDKRLEELERVGASVIDSDMLRRSCLRVGIDLSCAACANLFYGTRVDKPEAHVCKPAPAERPPTRREHELITLHQRRNLTMNAYKEDLADANTRIHELRAQVHELREALKKRGTHRTDCSQVGHPDVPCDCGFSTLIKAPPVPDIEPAAERIAAWIEHAAPDDSNEIRDARRYFADAIRRGAQR